MSNVKEIVNGIERGELNDARELINQTLSQKAAEVVDMKRVEQSMDWMNASENQEVPLESED
jgi:hypothetical protein